MRVEDARPEKPRLKPVENTVTEDVDSLRKKVKRCDRGKANNMEGVIVGFELPEGRTVQRGWTNPMVTSQGTKTSKKIEHKQSKTMNSKASKFSSGPECLFKTRLPPNAVDLANSRTEVKLRKRKRGLSTRDVVVHEFSNTKRHASFLRETRCVPDQGGTSEPVTSKGWVVQDGTSNSAGKKINRSRIFNKDGSSEPEPDSSSPIIPSNNSANHTDQSQTGEETSTSSNPTSSDSEDTTKPEIEALRVSPTAVAQSMTPDGRDIPEVPLNNNKAYHADAVARKTSSMSLSDRALATSGRLTEPHDTPEEDSVGTHPLETLFKRPRVAASSTPRKPTLEVSTSFSFFDHDTDEGMNTGLLMPQTPFTQQDFRERRQRSAAPTPDTAAPGKTFGDVWVGDQEHMEDDDQDRVNPSFTNQETSKGVPESDFSKWFWENRGETNRAWKRRRREAAKEKRQKGNKRK